MRVRFTPLAGLAALAAAAGFAPVDDKPEIPAPPVVPAKIDLPPKSFTETIPGTDVKFEMVYVPAGENLMGSPATEAGRTEDEGPQVRVKVRAFWIAKCECRWDEFDQWWKNEKLMAADEVPDTKKKPDAITRPTNPYVDELYEGGREGYPAICMTHHAAMMYCHWLRSKTKKGYRLPTEAEWEYACRAGNAGPYCFDPAKEKLDDYAWYKANSNDPEFDRRPQGSPHKVGTKKANAFGLNDMHGNVWEWCLDLNDPNFRKKFGVDKPFENVFNPPGDKKWGHVVKGGSWADKPDRVRSAARRVSDVSWMKKDPQLPKSIWWLTEMDMIGFRVCLPVEEYPALVGLKPMVEKKPD